MKTHIVAMLTALLATTPAFAVPGQKAIDAAVAALRLDFERDGIVGSPDDVKDLYQEACDLGYTSACKADQWHDEDGLPDIAAAAEVFEGQCARNDPAACMVEGWAIEAEPINDDLNGEERTDAIVNRLRKAQIKYRVGCASRHHAVCYELARYSWERVAVGDELPRQITNRENLTRRVLRDQCRADYMPSCSALGDMLPQEPEKLDTRNSAGWLYQKTCDEGYAQGCFRLGLLVAAQRTEAENRHWFEQLCERGHTDSCLWVARSWSETEGGATEAVEAWKRACLMHSPEACRKAGPLLVAERPAEALQVFRLGCAFDDGEACGNLGLLQLKQGQHIDAVPNLDRGCEAGVVDACVEVGLMRKSGEHMDADPAKAFEDLLVGCPQEGTRQARSCRAVGEMYEKSYGTEQDRAKAAEYYRFACELDHVESCKDIGQAVHQMQRTAQTQELLQWAHRGYVKACDRGVSDACLPAAESFAMGPTAFRDRVEAKQRLEGLCENKEQGDACLYLGKWLKKGPLIERDLVDARKAFSQGDDLGDSEATRQLGIMYWYGEGGSRKRGKAKRLFRKACAAGNGQACGGVSQPDFNR